MRLTVHRRAIPAVLALATLLAASWFSRDGRANNWARVFLNGVPVPVYFNDGDTFRVMGGELAGTPCRLAGFNTLESYGPVHQWGDWHPYELYILAKRATYNGRRGIWHCTSTGERDGYGRMLTDCPDLAVDQIRRGYAHAMTVSDEPAEPEYLRAQQEAMRHRRGIWAHGVPEFVMTSLHSLGERPGRDRAYNRRISTLDGHSEPWYHHQQYDECEWVCDTELQVDEARVSAAARRLRADPSLAPSLADLSNISLEALVSRFVRKDELGENIPAALHAPLRARLTQEREQGLLGEAQPQRGSCGLYARFQRRYGQNRAWCLRGHGSWNTYGRAVREGPLR